MEVDTQSDICLVHSLAWMSTYQFVLNQIINRQILRGDYGHEFSTKICTCSNNNAQANEGRFLNGLNTFCFHFKIEQQC